MASEDRPTGGSKMITTTIEDQFAEMRRRIARLQALAQAGLVAERARMQRHLDALHQEEASVAAVRGSPDEVEQKLGQLRTRLAVAENSLTADVSDQWTTFATAVEDELRSWDIYLERLQATAVAKAGNAREQAKRRLPMSAPNGSPSTTASRRRTTTSTARGRSRGTRLARLATSSNGRPTNSRCGSAIAAFEERRRKCKPSTRL
jgi:hypothetical protein